MKAFPSLIAALLLLLLLLSLSFVDATLEEICQKFDPKKNGGVDYNFCMTSLQVVPESHTADTRGLAIIATNLAKANVTHNLDKSKELLKSQNVSKESKEALSTCVDAYDDAVDAAKDAIEAIKSGDSDTFMTQLSALVTDVDTCIEGWEEVKEKSLMPKENDDADKISSVALGIAGMLQ